MLKPLDQPIIHGMLRLFLILYGTMVAPSLPDAVLKWFNFVPFRILILFLIVWIEKHDPASAILAAIAFYMTLNVLSGKQIFEKFQQQQYYSMQ